VTRECWGIGPFHGRARMAGVSWCGKQTFDARAQHFYA
jgi:hypothetical protein